MIVTFRRNEKLKSFNVVVQDDGVVEGIENHYIHLKAPTGETRVNFVQKNATVTVFDDDGKWQRWRG